MRMRWWIAAILLLAVPLISGCGWVQRPGIYQVGNWGPSLFLEDGQQVSLYTKQCKHVRVASFDYSSTTEYRYIFAEEPTKWSNPGYDHTDARRLWDVAPEWRREEKLIAVGKRMTADQPRPAKRILISSYNPVVIGFGPLDMTAQNADPFYNYMFFLNANPFYNFRAPLKIPLPNQPFIINPDSSN